MGMFQYQDIAILKSSAVKTDLKYLFKISAFSDCSKAIAPSELVRVLIPEISCHLDLTYVVPKTFLIEDIIF